MHILSQCIHGCKHFIGYVEKGYKCKAFDNIPDEIIFNRFDHRQEYEGDGGIRFEPKEDASITDFFDGDYDDPED